MRTMVESYIPLGFSLAACLQWVMQRPWTRVLFSFLLPLFLLLNLIQTHQFSHGILHHDSMTKEAYWAIFCRTKPVAKEFMEKRDAHLSIPNPKGSE